MLKLIDTELRRSDLRAEQLAFSLFAPKDASIRHVDHQLAKVRSRLQRFTRTFAVAEIVAIATCQPVDFASRRLEALKSTTVAWNRR